ncbi:MAG: translocation/assembly module TamB domain-containing protein [Deltaproteobacteria bacterium]|nr:translocation/assembly module TamB domain-containing protein [Deltaproteobacteria bacterium]
MKRGKKLKWHLLTVLLLTVVVIQTPFYLLNRPQVQRWILETYRPFAPWRIEIGSLKTTPWRFKIDLSNLRVSHPLGDEIIVKSVSLKINPLRLLRSQLGVSSLQIENTVINFAQNPDPKKEKKSFKIRTLLVLQNLVLDQGQIKNTVLNLPENKKITIDNFSIQLAPAFLGGTKFSVDLQKVLFQEEQEVQATSQEIKTNVSTNFTHWSKTFPYIDDVEGNLELKETQIGRLNLQNIEVSARFDKNKIVSKKLSFQIDENQILGNLEAHLESQKFLLNLDTPKPIHLPELDSETRTFNTAGELQMTLHLEGEGFDLKKSRGKGSIVAKHAFDNTETHAQLDSKFDWSGGALRLNETKVFNEESNIAVSGGIDLSPFSLHLKMKSENMVLERFFATFNDKNLHPIHGKGNVEVSLDGLAKTIHLKLSGESAEGGFGIIRAEKAHIDLDITQPQLKLNGQIFTDNKPTGEAQFTIDYGPKTPEGIRSKKVNLVTTIHDQSLEKMLPGYLLTGTLSGTFNLSGPAQAMRGEGKLNASQGTFLDGAFEEVQTHFILTNKNFVIDKADFQLPNSNSHLAKPITFDFLTDGDFKLSGQPFSGVSIDIFYQGKTKRWEIRKFFIDDLHDPDLKAKVIGFVQQDVMNLKGSGNIELSRLPFFSKIIRDATGPALFNLEVHGNPSDLQANGKVELNNVSMTLKPFGIIPEELKGTIYFQGNRIRTDLLTGILGSGEFQLKGNITHSHSKPAAYDLAFSGKQLYLHDTASGFRMDYDADLTFKGPAQNPELTGSLVVLDGRYTKDFNIIEELKEAPKTSKQIQEAALKTSPIHFNLQVRNFGDLFIDNNIGKIALNVDVNIRGTKLNPSVDGTVTAQEGTIRYLGLDFDITNGFAEFRNKLDDPYLEIQAERDIDDAHIVAVLHGPPSSLRMDLSGNSSQGSLEKKDVVSLLLFGMTTNERVELAEEQSGIGTALVAEQITHILQRPIASFTGLDVFRLETENTQNGQTRQFYLGKKLNDRLSVEFASEINQYNDALQRFRLEYWLTDSFLFKGSRSSNESYQLNLGVRFISR